MKNNRDGNEMMMRDGKNGEGMTITKLGCNNNLHLENLERTLCSPKFSPYKFFPFSKKKRGKFG
jgi:hypothetical protein